MIAGVAVALIIVFTLWAKQSPQHATHNMVGKDSFSINDLKASLIDRTLAEVAR